MQLLKPQNPPKTYREYTHFPLALAFCNEVLALIETKRYSEPLIAKTVDSILLELDDCKDGKLKNELRMMLVKEVPYINWSFKPFVEALHK
ncbi:MAG TPA: hypothetical protein VNF06_03025 [Candidatus Aquilonibacter sp.]|nr:hypothetical protein [Candidatus Aquilonibacter sp.]